MVDCFLRLPRHRHPGWLLLQVLQVTCQKLVLELVSKTPLVWYTTFQNISDLPEAQQGPVHLGMRYRSCTI